MDISYLKEIESKLISKFLPGSDVSCYLKLGRDEASLREFKLVCRAGKIAYSVKDGKATHNTVQGISYDDIDGFILKRQSYWEQFPDGTYEEQFDFVVARFDLSQMVGCCGICISHNSWVNKAYRDLGIGTILNQMRQQIAFQLSNSLMICTDVDTNVAQKRLLEKTNWKLLDSFVNCRTGNTVNLHSIHLKHSGRPIGTKWIDDLEREYKDS